MSASSWPAIRAAAREVPERAAFVEQGGEVVTYADFGARVEGAMRGLGELGVRAGAGGAGVALPGEPAVSTLVVIGALVEMGVPVVPVHPKLSAHERTELLDTLQPAFALDGTQVRELADRRRTGPPLSVPDPSPAAPLAIVATSGTSGTPKGVVLSRRAFAAAADASAANLGWREDDRWLLCMPLAHVGGLTIPLRTLAARRTTVCGPHGSFDPTAIIDIIERHRVTIASLVPTMLVRLLDDPAGWVPPSHLRAILLGGAGPAGRLLDRCRARGVPVLTTYGLTETCGQVTTQRPGTAPSEEQGAGEVLSGLQVKIVRGEIQVRGPSLLRGYVGCSTAVPKTEDGFFRTGDAGSLDAEGRLHVLGRLDDRIVTGGENVDPLQVERALEALPGVRKACVFGVDDPTWGQQVATVLVLEQGASAEALKRTVRGRLAAHRRPRLVVFADDLPTTRSGKVDRRAAARAVRHRLEPF